MAQSVVVKFAPPKTRRERFVGNVLWSWAGVVFNILIGFFISPYIIHKLGSDGYGLWVLLSSLIGYYALLDFGFKSALVRYTALFEAEHGNEKINQLASTVLFYYTLCSLVLMGVSIFLSQRFGTLFHVAPAHHKEFTGLLILIGLNFLVGMNPFGGVLEGLQRFDITTRIYVLSLAVRSLGAIAVLALGCGIFALGMNLILAQTLMLVLCWNALRKVFPLRLSFSLVKWPVLKQTAGFGVHSFLANVATNFLTDGIGVVIAIFLSPSFVGYFFIPWRLLQYTVDMVDRVGVVATPNASEMTAKREFDAIMRLGIYANRYSFALFMPLALFLLAYGKAFLDRWIGPSFSGFSAPLLPVMVIGTAIALAGQCTSVGILFGMAKHKQYARGVLLEAAITLALMVAIIPRYGILGAAVVCSLMMVLVRGIYTPSLMCRNTNFSFARYMASIYVRPCVAAIPVAAVLIWARYSLPAPHTWPQLVTAGLLIASGYAAIAFFACVDDQHRSMLFRSLRRSVGQPD